MKKRKDELRIVSAVYLYLSNVLKKCQLFDHLVARYCTFLSNEFVEVFG